MFLTIVNTLSNTTLLVGLHIFILPSCIYLYRLSTVGKIAILHRHQCKTCGIICECESNLDCNPSILMNYICLTCRNYWHAWKGCSTSMRITFTFEDSGFRNSSLPYWLHTKMRVLIERVREKEPLLKKW